MSRLCWGLLVCLAGLGMPAITQAQCCGSTWGSSYYAGYAPYYAGYTGYYAAPYATGYWPGVGCTNCQACGCSPCGGNCGSGCASGNCSLGCSTTANSSGALAPTPDPNNGGAGSIESRLQALERALNITPPRTNNRTYDDQFNSRNRGGTTIPGRSSTGSDNPDDFPLPRRNNSNNSNTNDVEPFPENDRSSSSARDTFRPDLGAPDADASKNGTVIPSKKPAPATGVEDKSKSTEEKSNQSLRLDTRLTSRAVSPRERQNIGGQAAKPAIAASKPNKTSLKVDAHPQTVNVARY